MVFISQTGRLLRGLVRLSCRYPALTVALSVLLGALGLWYTLHELSFRTSGRDLLPEHAGYVVRYTEYKKEFGESHTSSFSSIVTGRSPKPLPSTRIWAHFRS